MALPAVGEMGWVGTSRLDLLTTGQPSEPTAVAGQTRLPLTDPAVQLDLSLEVGELLDRAGVGPRA